MLPLRHPGQMDLKTHILRWERDISENPAIALLVILIALAAVFIIAIIIDAFIKWRRQNPNNRRRR
jgi:hypothetical protein